MFLLFCIIMSQHISRYLGLSCTMLFKIYTDLQCIIMFPRFAMKLAKIWDKCFRITYLYPLQLSWGPHPGLHVLPPRLQWRRQDWQVLRWTFKGKLWGQAVLREATLWLVQQWGNWTSIWMLSKIGTLLHGCWDKNDLCRAQSGSESLDWLPYNFCFFIINHSLFKAFQVQFHFFRTIQITHEIKTKPYFFWY